MKTCVFFGHQNAPNDIYPKLTETIECLITDEGVNNFYVGNNGNFDSLARKALKEAKLRYPEITFINFVLQRKKEAA